MKHCPGCGAPYEAYRSKCPYCGVSYFDMSCLDLDANEPCYIRLKVRGWDGKPMIVTQLVRLVPDLSMSVEDDYTYATGADGMVTRFPTSKRTQLNLTFEGVPDPERGTLFNVEVTE